MDGIGPVRLIGVDTPETVDPRRPVQYFGLEASAFTGHSLSARVRLEFGGPRGERLPMSTCPMAPSWRRSFGRAMGSRTWHSCSSTSRNFAATNVRRVRRSGVVEVSLVGRTR
ncbi:MAG: thermonuclease family protein [Vicinamibacterales bacterium]